MTKSCLSLFSLIFATGCGGVVDDPYGEPAAAGAAGGKPSPAAQGMPCSALHGQATLTAYTGENYASSAFSFEYASQDAELTYNEFEVLYTGNWFSVNMVTDDRSTIVDLGAIELIDVPGWVDPSGYPTGQWDEYDAISAHLDHTYFVHSVDSAGELVSAFKVVGLQPGVQVSIEWIRSTSPTELVVPAACL